MIVTEYLTISSTNGNFCLLICPISP
ncbi:hypothetical protein CY0110_18377 [Crocosphaera chwakensis CCY0110]|uniref:Uncharacterized protein n=1 Tax=Crocosphaera chwakensis CCY0110 TaxID=391612 RepID=A3IJ07_9CHRO|nr:hypothetical protein CY0110_18377 [Crocosphaera chwakensis CCY0110]